MCVFFLFFSCGFCTFTLSISHLYMKQTTKAAAVQGASPAKSQQQGPELSTLAVAPKEEIAPTSKTKVLTVEDRKGRHEIFEKLLEKHEVYKETSQKIEAFVIGSDEHSQTLQLHDSKGNLFKTGNPVLLKEVMTLIRAQINAQVGVIEDDILNFII
jgi:hypothetical protein